MKTQLWLFHWCLVLWSYESSRAFLAIPLPWAHWRHPILGGVEAPGTPGSFLPSEKIALCCETPQRLQQQQQEQPTDTDDSTILSLRTHLHSLLHEAGLDLTRVLSVTELEEKAAFCNSVYRIVIQHHDPDDTCSSTSQTNNITTTTNSSKSVIAKIFSELALARMDPNRSLGELDDYCARFGLAPCTITRTNRGILMEDCKGRVLTEELAYGEEWSTRIAVALAKLHSLPGPPIASQDDKECVSPRPQSNVLVWSCHVMLSRIKFSWNCTVGGIRWDRTRLATALVEELHNIQHQRANVVPVGHGDCKPSNVIALEDGTVVFVDLELLGQHYRAYDLAKFLRSNYNATFHEAFLRCYLQSCTTVTANPDAVKQLMNEVNLLMPLTWLEAAIFFAAMACLNPHETKKWNSLVANRLEYYLDQKQTKIVCL